MNASCRILFAFVLVFVLLGHRTAIADGTRELEGAGGVTKLLVGKMAALGSDSNLSLNVRVIRPNQERIYFGFAAQAAGSTTLPIYFHIVDPFGNVVVGPTLLPTTGPGYINSLTEAIIGPTTLENSNGGYTPLSFDPVFAGDHKFEFFTSPQMPQSFNLIFERFDITVGSIFTNKPLPGRLWSRQWVLNSNSFGNRSFAKFHVYTPDSVVTRLDLNGMQGYGFEVSCNISGPRFTGNVVSDRKSVQGNVVYPQYKIFLTNPDSVAFPSGLGAVSLSSPITITGCPATNYCIQIDLNKSANTMVYLELNGQAGYQSSSADLMIEKSLVRGKNCVEWDGKNGLGQLVPIGTSVMANISVIAGLTNFPIFDAEQNTNGFRIDIVRPRGPQPLVFWDDLNFSNGTTELDGCTGSCHSWTSNLGNNRTMNTWWYTGKVSKTINYTIVQNCPLIANNDTITVAMNDSIVISPMRNDIDPDKNIDSTSFNIYSGLSNGTLTPLDNGRFLYKPYPGFICDDKAAYSLSDMGPTAYVNLARYTDSAMIFFKVVPPMPKTNRVSFTFCKGQPTARIVLEPALPGLEHRWYLPGMGTVYTNLAPDTISSDSAGIFIYRITQSKPGAVCESEVLIVTVNILNVPNADFSGLGLEYCEGAPTSLLVPVTPGGFFAGPNVVGNRFEPNAPGQFEVSYTVGNGTCQAIERKTVVVKPLADSDFSGVTTNSCVGYVYNLLPNTPGGTFTGNAITGNVFAPATPGRYPITYTTVLNGCTSSTQKVIDIVGRRQLSFTPLPQTLCTNNNAISLVPNILGGTFIGLDVQGSTFVPRNVGPQTILYVLSNGNCIDTASQTVDIKAAPNGEFTGLNPTYCLGNDTVVLTPVVPGGVFSGNQLVGGNKFLLSSAGDWTITYTIVANGCTTIENKKVRVFPLPDAGFVGINKGYCVGDAPVTLIANRPGGVFSGDGVNGNQFDPGGVGEKTIAHTLIVNGCSSTQVKTVQVGLPLDAKFTKSATILCLNEGPVRLNSNTEGGKFYVNNKSIEGNLWVPDKIGKTAIRYQVENNGCITTSLDTVEVKALPEIRVTAPSTQLMEGNPVRLIATGGVSYLWKPVALLSDSTSSAPLAVPRENTRFTVKGFGVNGCYNTAQIDIVVKQLLRVYNIMTPNGDGHNDVLYVNGSAEYPELEIEIFNRYGSKVYSKKNYDNSFSGSGLPEGVYFYVLTPGKGLPQIKGNFELIR